MLEGIINDKEEEKKSSTVEKDEDTSVDLDKKYAVNNFEDPTTSKVSDFEKTLFEINSDFNQKLFDLKKSIEDERNAIQKEKEEATQDFLNNTEAGKYISNQDTLHEYARGRELETMNEDKNTSEELKGYKLNAMQFIREKFATDPVANAYLEKQTEYLKKIVQLNDIERDIESQIKK